MTTEQSEHAAVVTSVAWATLAVALALLAIVIVEQPAIALRATVTGVIVAAICATTVLLSRRGHSRAGAWVLVLGLVALVALLSLQAGGVRSPGSGGYLTFVLMSGILLGAKSGVLTGIVCMLVGLTLVVADATGRLPAATIQYGSVTVWLLQCIYIGVVIVLQRLAARTVFSALDRATKELAARKEAEREREELLWQLRERIKELGLMHAATKILQGSHQLHRETLERLVAETPQAWQYPECCEARIAVGDIIAVTPGYRVTPWLQSAAFKSAGGNGSISVVYTDERPPSSEGPFLAEERALIDSLAGLIVSRLERSAAESQRRRIEQQLRQSQKMQALGTLAGGVAHDFNNILTAIRGNVDLAREELPGDHAARMSLDEIGNASARAVDLVKRILVFSRPQPPERRVVSLVSLTNEVLALLRVSLPRGVTIETRYTDRAPDALADPTQIHQVLLNLGTNAVHAMKSRGGVLTVSLDTVIVDDLGASPSADLKPGQCIRIRVSDTGTGMSKEIQDRIFEPFFTTKGEGGTGLGLSVVHGIIREHEGAITVYSEPNVGTTFSVYLPVVDAAAAAASATPTKIRDGAGKRVLYVDDEEAIVFLMTRMFKRLGYEFAGFTDPHAALQAYRSAPNDYDVVVTDMSMPRMNGLQFAKEILAIRPDAHVALASGWDHTPVAKAAGIKTILSKPATIQELAAAIDRALSEE